MILAVLPFKCPYDLKLSSGHSNRYGGVNLSRGYPQSRVKKEKKNLKWSSRTANTQVVAMHSLVAGWLNKHLPLYTLT